MHDSPLIIIANHRVVKEKKDRGEGGESVCEREKEGGSCLPQKQAWERAGGRVREKLGTLVA